MNRNRKIVLGAKLGKEENGELKSEASTGPNKSEASTGPNTRKGGEE